MNLSNRKKLLFKMYIIKNILLYWIDWDRNTMNKEILRVKIKITKAQCLNKIIYHLVKIIYPLVKIIITQIKGKINNFSQILILH